MLTVIFHQTSHFLERVEKDKSLVGGWEVDCELDLESSELVGGPIVG